MSELQRLPGTAGKQIAVRVQGDAGAPMVYFSHSILSSGMMWQAQAELLAAAGWRVVRADTRGHGDSSAPTGDCTMDDLADDVVAVLDALGVARAHYVGLSLGGMTGFGLGLRHPDRLLSLCLCDCRADMPAPLGAAWDERIALAQTQGCAALAESTTERWFGPAFLGAQPETAQRFRAAVAATSVAGFRACARAIQGLDYLPRVATIDVPTTLIVGANDGPFPQAMTELRERMAGSVLELIPGAGHLPNIDQPEAFNAALLRHFARVA